MNEYDDLSIITSHELSQMSSLFMYGSSNLSHPSSRFSQALSLIMYGYDDLLDSISLGSSKS